MSRNINGVFIIPTGLACSIGGDAGANAQVKLIAECCNTLIVNPNAVNASDINEMTPNCLYVEGSTIDRFLENKINLKQVKNHNTILAVLNDPIVPDNYNAINASIHTLGADVEIVKLKTPLIMKAKINKDGTAGGEYSGVDELIQQIKVYDFDALAVYTEINCSHEISNKYWKGEIEVNPWGRVEALVSKIIANKIDKPVAHAPIEGEADRDLLSLRNTTVVDISKAPEIISNCYAHCIFKGLHRAPRIVESGDRNSLSEKDFDFLITPFGCWDRPHDACLKNNITIIVVKENKTCFKNFEYPKKIFHSEKVIFVDNYLEAAGVIMAMNSGVSIKSILLSRGKEYFI